MKPQYIMGPLIEVLGEAAQSGSRVFQSLAGLLIPALTPFLEEKATDSLESAAWAISEGMLSTQVSFPFCSMPVCYATLA